LTEEQEKTERNLGELTEELARERGELIPGDDLAPPPYADIPDVTIPAHVEIGRNVPPLDKQVLSAFDARPLNARDFYYTQRSQFIIIA